MEDKLLIVSQVNKSDKIQVSLFWSVPKVHNTENPMQERLRWTDDYVKIHELFTQL